MDNFHLITGCSSGGKSTLLNELANRGYTTIPEAGLRVIREGGPRPWEDLPNFLSAVQTKVLNDLESQRMNPDPIFFDRGLLDTLSAVAALREIPISELMAPQCPYAEPVFFAPPWEEIFEATEDRRTTFEAAVAEAERIRRDLDRLRIEVIELPLTSVADRADLIERQFS